MSINADRGPWVMLKWDLGGFVCWALTILENIPASLPRAQKDGRSVAVAESSAPGLGNAGLEHVCATSLLFPGARHSGDLELQEILWCDHAVKGTRCMITLQDHT